MSTFDIFSTPIKYKFKTRLCSISTLIVFLLKFLSVTIPLFITFQAGGFWLKQRVYIEAPTVHFMNKYLLIAERDRPDMAPIVCSTITVYRQNPIVDECHLVKLQQIDMNKDRRKDLLKFEMQFYSDTPIRSVKLLLYFEIKLKENIPNKFVSLIMLDAVVPHEVQKIQLIGDLTLHQREIIQKSYYPGMDNETIELSDHTIDELLAYNARNKVSAEITNIRKTWQTGFFNEEPVTVNGEIFYMQQLLYYQPNIWEELKWAWIQYLSILIVSVYLTNCILKFLFNKNYLKSYIVIPWKNK